MVLTESIQKQGYPLSKSHENRSLRSMNRNRNPCKVILKLCAWSFCNMERERLAIRNGEFIRSGEFIRWTKRMPGEAREE